MPHFVRGCRASLAGGVARNTLAVFTREYTSPSTRKIGQVTQCYILEPNLYEMVDKDRDFATFAKQIVEQNTTEGM